MERISRSARWVLVIAMVVLGLACMVQAKNVAEANATIAASLPSTSAPAVQPSPAEPPCIDSGKGLFNDCAVLDTARIDDLRSVADKGDELFVAEDGHLIAADAE
jgi:hypothetical protein